MCSLPTKAGEGTGEGENHPYPHGLHPATILYHVFNPNQNRLTTLEDIFILIDMMTDHTCWWAFPGSSKIDVLEEEIHYKQLICALRDPCTQISIARNRFIIHDDDKALLVVPHRLSLQLLLFLHQSFLSICYQN